MATKNMIALIIYLIIYSHCDNVMSTIKINEIFISPEEDAHGSRSQYLELIIDGDATTQLPRYTLFVLSSTPNSIIELVDLGHIFYGFEYVEDERFVVLSNHADYSNVGVLFENAFPNDEEKVAYILTQRPSSSAFRTLGITETHGELFLHERKLIGENEARVLRRIAQDGISLTKNEIDRDTWLQTIIPAFVGNTALLPIGRSSSVDSLSLNRCKENTLNTNSFWYGIPTPGTPNVCASNELTFHDECPSATSTQAVEDDSQEGSGAIVEDSDTEAACDVSEGMSPVETSLDIIKRNHILHPNLLSYLSNEENVKYLMYKDDGVDPTDSTLHKGRFFCKACQSVLRKPNPKIAVRKKKYQNIMTVGMDIPKEPTQTLRLLKSHLGGQEHDKFVKDYEGEDVVEEYDETDYEVTARLIGLVYLETKLGISLSAHADLVRGLKILGLNMGCRLATRFTATNMVALISKQLHEDMINLMMQSRTYFSLLLDSSTDVAGDHGLLLYFVYIENNQPVLRLWRYVEAKDSAAKPLFDHIMRLVESEKEGFSQYFKSYLASIATDGASNMIGRYNSVVQKFTQLIRESNTNRQLQSYHCNNHLLALAYNDVTYSKAPDLQFTKKMINACNSLSTFYSSKAYKRREELYGLAAETDEKYKRFQKIKKVRWIPASQNSFRIVNENYNLFMTHLAKIKEDARQYTAESRNEAHRLHSIFGDRNLLATMYHHLDLISELTIWAKHMERKTNNIIDVYHWRQKVSKTFSSLQSTPGSVLQGFLDECQCDESPCTGVEEFESAVNVTFRTHNIQNGGSTLPALSATRELIVLEIIKAIDYRFPEKSISAFSVLNPSQIVESGNVNWNKLAKYYKEYFGWPSSIYDNLLEMKRRVVLLEDLNDLVGLSPEKFWMRILEVVNFNGIEDVRQALHIALVQPAGTAQVESGFSFVNFIKNKLRASLKIPTVENILRIKQNGMDFQTFPRYAIAERWVKEGRMQAEKKPRKC